MKAHYVPAILLVLALARPGPATAGQATTTIGVGATVVASCALRVDSHHASEPITASCTPQTAVRIGQVSDGEGQPKAEDTGKQSTRVTEGLAHDAQTREVTVEF